MEPLDGGQGRQVQSDELRRRERSQPVLHAGEHAAPGRQTAPGQYTARGCLSWLVGGEMLMRYGRNTCEIVARYCCNRRIARTARITRTALR